jgi:Tyrosine phosphatase family
VGALVVFQRLTALLLVEQAELQEIMRFLHETEQQVKEFIRSPFDAMHHTLALFRQDYRTFTSYFEHQLGFTPDEIRQLKDILIVDTGHQAQDDAVHRLVREREAKL